MARNPPFDTNEADNEILYDENREKMRHPEFVESDVIVDLAEAYQKNPDWRPTFHRLTLTKSIRCEVEDDDMNIQQWFDAGRQNLAYAQRLGRAGFKASAHLIQPGTVHERSKKMGVQCVS